MMSVWPSNGSRYPRMASRRRAFVVFPLVCAILVALDQYTKYLALSQLKMLEPLPVTGFLNLTLVFNRGAAFGFLNNQSGWQLVMFAIIALLVIVYMIWHILGEAHRQPLSVLAYGLIGGGAVGNLIDRLRFGYVVDFVDFHFAGWHFWVFNLADSALTIGVILLLWAAWKDHREAQRVRPEVPLE